MKLEEHYTISELLQLNEESARNEFKPKFGNGAKRSSSDNDKAVKDIIKNAEKLDKDGRREDKKVTPEVEFPDYNKTTLDVNFEYDPGEDWKKRVQAQAEGYPSVQNKKDGEYAESLDFDGNKNFYDARKKMSKDRDKLETGERESGLKAKEKAKLGVVDYSNKTSFVNEEVYNVQVFTQDKRRTKEFDDKDEAEKYAKDLKKKHPNDEVQLGDRKVENVLSNDDKVDNSVINSDKKDDVKESKQIKRLNEDYEHKLQHAGDVLDYYANLTHDTGHKLSSDQINQIKNLLMWLEETNASDNQVQDEYINLAKQLISDNSFNESKQIKRLKFKNTIFLSESHLLSKVPEDYRVDENRFYMQDKTGTDYLVECAADPFGYIHMEVVRKYNAKLINEELEKMKRLAGYKYSDDNKKVDAKKLENMQESISNFRELLNN